MYGSRNAALRRPSTTIGSEERRYAEAGEPLERGLEVGHGDPKVRPAEVVRRPVRDGALLRRRMVEELELNEVLAADEPPEREGRILAETLNVGDAWAPEHLAAGLGESERLAVELDGASYVGSAESDLCQLGSHSFRLSVRTRLINRTTVWQIVTRAIESRPWTTSAPWSRS